MAENKEQGEWTLPYWWAWTTIGTITQPIEKVKPRENPDAQFTYLDISSIDNTAYRITEPKTYQGAEAPSRARQLVKANDVLFSTVRTYLKNIALVPETYDGQIASTGFSVLRTQADISPKYLFYYTLSDRFVNDLGKLQRGTSYPAVRDGDIRVQPFPLAPLPEQHRIVAEIETQFTRLDAGVAALERAQANLKRYRAAVLKAACEGRLVPTEAELARAEDRDYEPADQLLARILAERRAKWEAEQWQKEIERAKKKAAQVKRKAAGLPARISNLANDDWQDLPEEAYAKHLPKSDRWKSKFEEPQLPDFEDSLDLPDGWAWTSVQNLAAFDSNSICAGPFGTIFKARDFRPSGVPIVFLRHVKPASYLRHRKPTFMDEDRWQELFQSYSVYGGELLVTKLGEPPGTCAIYPYNIGPAMLTPDVMKMQVNERVTLPSFLMHYFNSQMAKRFAFGAAFGTTRLRLTLPIFRNLPVPLPPLAEQHRIVAEVDRRLSVVAALEAEAEAALARAARLRQSILKRAFEGRLVEQDPNDEPASVLLARIRAERDGMRGKRTNPRAEQPSLPGMQE